jgi:hypothetical protein
MTTLCTSITSDAENLGEDVVFSGLTDGSTSLGLFKAAIGVSEDTPLSSTDYPAWAFVENYATTAGLTGTYASGWYMPAMAEFSTLYKVKDTVNAALGMISGADQLTGSTYPYWSCNQESGFLNYAERKAWTALFDSPGVAGKQLKDGFQYAVRVIRAF